MKNAITKTNIGQNIMENEPVLFTDNDLHELIRSKVTSQMTAGLTPSICIGDDNIAPADHPDIVTIRKFAFHTALEISTLSGEFEALKAIDLPQRKAPKQLEIYSDLGTMAKLIEVYILTGEFPLPKALK